MIYWFWLFAVCLVCGVVIYCLVICLFGLSLLVAVGCYLILCNWLVCDFAAYVVWNVGFCVLGVVGFVVDLFMFSWHLFVDCGVCLVLSFVLVLRWVVAVCMVSLVVWAFFYLVGFIVLFVVLLYWCCWDFYLMFDSYCCVWLFGSYLFVCLVWVWFVI